MTISEVQSQIELSPQMSCVNFLNMRVLSVSNKNYNKKLKFHEKCLCFESGLFNNNNNNNFIHSCTSLKIYINIVKN